MFRVENIKNKIRLNYLKVKSKNKSTANVFNS